MWVIVNKFWTKRGCICSQKWNLLSGLSSFSFSKLSLYGWYLFVFKICSIVSIDERENSEASVIWLLLWSKWTGSKSFLLVSHYKQNRYRQTSLITHESFTFLSGWLSLNKRAVSLASTPINLEIKFNNFISFWIEINHVLQWN